MIKKLINSKLGQQIIKFGAVGFLCFFIEYVLLILFKELLGWPVIAANTLAFTVSAIVNYILSILFVFDTDKKANQSKQFAVFFILAVGGLILNNVVLKLGTMVLDPFGRLSYWPFATGVVMVITCEDFIEKSRKKKLVRRKTMDTLQHSIV
ncbi:MAG: GtrA family protein [Gallintestinimicrobium sp.]